jgi:hypothetical protein
MPFAFLAEAGIQPFTFLAEEDGLPRFARNDTFFMRHFKCNAEI